MRKPVDLNTMYFERTDLWTTYKYIYRYRYL